MRAGIGWLVLGITALLALRRPRIALFGLIACDYIRPQDANVTYGFESVKFSWVYTLVSLGTLVVGWRKYRLRWEAFHGGVFWLFLAVVNSAVWAFDRSLALPRVDDYFKTLLQYVLVCAFIRSLKDLRQLYWTLGLSIAFVAGRYCYGKFVLGEYGWEGPTDDRNELAMMLVMALPFLLVLGLTSKRTLARAVTVLALGPCALVIVFTLSRGGFLGLAAVSGYLLLRLRHRRWLLAAAAVGVFFGLSYVPPEFYARIGTVQTAETQDASARGRINAWHASWAMFQDRPLTGVGVGNFLVHFDRYAPDPHDPHVAHSSFFQIMGDTGLPGLAAWLYLVLRMWFTAGATEKRLKRSQGSRWTEARYLLAAVQAAWLGYVICGLFLSQEDFDFFYLLLGVTSRLRTLAFVPAALPAATVTAGGGDPGDVQPAAAVGA